MGNKIRIGFTIVLNGLRHLKHNDYYKILPNILDHWIIVEGVSLPTGSTSWCKELPDSMHKNYLSNDGTTELLDSIKCNKIHIVRPIIGPWKNKDEQVNAAIKVARSLTNECMLWQIDVDEQWYPEDMIKAEEHLIKNNGKTGCFLCNYYVGKNQVAFGHWGEGNYEPYRRLWNWKGENFISHEPPKLEGKNGPGLLLTQRFNHYAYYFEEDVKFKEVYYGGYEGLHERWKEVQENREIIPVENLLGPNTWWSKTQTYIKYINDRPV